MSKLTAIGILLTTMTLVIVMVAPAAHAQRGRGRGHDAAHQHDRATFQYLLRHRDQIERKVTRRPDGVETLTESKNPEVVAKLKDHVHAMHGRLEEGRPIHQRDQLFREVFRHADQIELKIDETAQGVRVVETSEDPYVVRLIQAHAEVVNRFLEHGHEEVRKSHPLPPRDDSQP